MSFSSSMGAGIAWRKCSCRVAQSGQRGVVAQAELRNPTGCATARRLRKPQAELRNPGSCASGVAQSWNLRKPSFAILAYAIRRSCGIGLYSLTKRGKLSQTSQATRQCLHVCPARRISTSPIALAVILGYEPSVGHSSVDVTKRHACRAKGMWMSPSATPAPKVPWRHGRPTPAKRATRRSQVP